MTADMTKGNPLKLIIAFAVPMLIGNIFQQIYNFADASILGSFVGERALAAVGATGGMASVLIASVMGFTNGGGIIISQTIGAKKYGEMQKTITALIYIVSVMSIIVSIAGNIFSKPILLLLSTPAELLGDSAAYIKIIFTFIPATVFYNASGAVLRSLGDSKTPLIALIIATFLNVVMDLLFIVGFGWGIRGAATATGIAQIISVIFNFAVITKRRNELNLTRLPITPAAAEIKKIIVTGLPAALESSLLSLGTISVQRLVNTFGTMTIAAYTASTRIDSIAIAPIISIGNALSVYTAQNVGARDIPRVRQGLYKALAALLALCLAIVVFIVILRRPLLRLFLDSEEAVSIGSQYLIIVSIAYFVAAIMRSYMNVLRGAGDVNISAVSGITELAVRIIFAYILVIPFHATGIWLATPIAWSCGALITVLRFYSGKWLTKRLV